MSDDPSHPKYAYLRTWPPDVLMEALAAAGVERRLARGAKVLLGHRPDQGWRPCFNTMVDLRELADLVVRPVGRNMRELTAYYRRRLTAAGRAYRSHGGVGDCMCLWCRLWRMRLGDLEETLSEW